MVRGPAQQPIPPGPVARVLPQRREVRDGPRPPGPHGRQPHQQRQQECGQPRVGAQRGRARPHEQRVRRRDVEEVPVRDRACDAVQHDEQVERGADHEAGGPCGRRQQQRWEQELRGEPEEREGVGGGGGLEVSRGRTVQRLAEAPGPARAVGEQRGGYVGPPGATLREAGPEPLCALHGPGGGQACLPRPTEAEEEGEVVEAHRREVGPEVQEGEREVGPHDRQQSA